MPAEQRGRGRLDQKAANVFGIDIGLRSVPCDQEESSIVCRAGVRLRVFGEGFWVTLTMMHACLGARKL